MSTHLLLNNSGKSVENLLIKIHKGNSGTRHGQVEVGGGGGGGDSIAGCKRIHVIKKKGGEKEN